MAPKGDRFYSDHLLFERLYGGLDSLIDSTAEKTVALCGDVLIATELNEKAGKWLARWEKAEAEFVQRALSAERDLQKALSLTLDVCEKDGVLTKGLDNHLRAIADARDTATYLLGRVV
jgi:DNA-binding ferritin-like protein